jgi:hypothetical protein
MNPSPDMVTVAVRATEFTSSVFGNAYAAGKTKENIGTTVTKDTRNLITSLIDLLMTSSIPNQIKHDCS